MVIEMSIKKAGPISGPAFFFNRRSIYFSLFLPLFRMTTVSFP